ncbi:MAG TPA: histidine kinase dimerization/phospho-acceptor domain-containing protein, partial [Anaerolineae bacterium]|nr:histidine kinase dimerization/phospho-acceptor domain-containing protein [Anaerolineae bacterium]
MTLLDVVLFIIVIVLGTQLWRTRRAQRAVQDQLDNYAAQASELTDQLHQLEARAAALTSGPPHPLLVVDAAGSIGLANTRAREVLGRDLIGSTVIEATRSHEIDAVVQAALSQRQISEQPVTWNIRPYFVRVVPIGSGGAVVVLEDQTELQRLERVRRDFVANISHELRTPLAAIRLLVETLLAGAQDEPQVANHMLNQVITEVDALTQLAQELLDLSMIESGQMPMQVRAADVRDVIDEQLQHFEPQAQQKQIALNNIAPIGLRAEIDRKLIGRVLGNLIHNALKFTPKNGQITIGAESTAEKITISVSDTGPGI